MNSKRIKKYLWVLLYVCAGGFLVYYLVKYTGTSLSLLSLHIVPYLLGALALNFVTFFFAAFAWAFMVKRHFPETRTGQLVKSYYISQITRYVPGNVWSFVARYKNVKQLGVKGQAIGFYLAVENINLILTAFIFAFFSIAILGKGYTIPVIGLAIFLGVLFGVLLFKPELFKKVLQVFAKKFKSDISYDNLTKSDLLIVCILYLLYWISFGFGFYLLVLGGIGNTLSPIASIGVNAAAWVIGYVSFLTPSGLGVREGIFVLILSKYTSPVHALGIAILARFILLLAEVSGLGVSAIWGKGEDHKIEERA